MYLLHQHCELLDLGFSEQESQEQHDMVPVLYPSVSVAVTQSAPCCNVTSTSDPTSAVEMDVCGYIVSKSGPRGSECNSSSRFDAIHYVA